MKKALITGITGQDGYYLTKLLLKKGYQVHGIKRRTSLINTQRIDEFFNDKNLHDKRFTLYHGDMTDSSSLIGILNKVKPNEIYNLSGQTSVGLSFEEPVECLESISSATLTILKAIRYFDKNIRFFNAGSTDCFGDTGNKAAMETTPFGPTSPY